MGDVFDYDNEEHRRMLEMWCHMGLDVVWSRGKEGPWSPHDSGLAKHVLNHIKSSKDRSWYFKLDTET